MADTRPVEDPANATGGLLVEIVRLEYRETNRATSRYMVPSEERQNQGSRHHSQFVHAYSGMQRIRGQHSRYLWNSEPLAGIAST